MGRAARAEGGRVSLDPTLLEILACPKDKGPLRYDAAANLLINDRQGIAYPIEDGIPVLLVDEARPYPAAPDEDTAPHEGDA